MGKKILIGCGVLVGLFVAFIILVFVLAAKTGNLKVESSFKATPAGVSQNKEFTKNADTPIDSKMVKVAAKKEVKEIKDMIDLYFDKFNDENDEYIYENIYHPGFRENYSLDRIIEIHKGIRKPGGKVLSYDLDKAVINIKTDNTGSYYTIESMPVVMEKDETVDCTLKMKKEGKKDLRIISFNFKG